MVGLQCFPLYLKSLENHQVSSQLPSGNYSSIKPNWAVIWKFIWITVNDFFKRYGNNSQTFIIYVFKTVVNHLFCFQNSTRSLNNINWCLHFSTYCLLSKPMRWAGGSKFTQNWLNKVRFVGSMPTAFKDFGNCKPLFCKSCGERILFLRQPALSDGCPSPNVMPTSKRKNLWEAVYGMFYARWTGIAEMWHASYVNADSDVFIVGKDDWQIPSLFGTTKKDCVEILH